MMTQTETINYTAKEYLELELASESRSEKFAAYRTIPTFREYLVIDQYRLHVEHYVKTAVNQWMFSEYDNANISLSFSSLEFSIEISDLYDNIEFTES